MLHSAYAQAIHRLDAGTNQGAIGEALFANQLPDIQV